MKETKHRMSERTFDQFMEKLAVVYGTRGDIVEFEALRKWQSIKRRANESIRAFLFRFEEGMTIAEEHGCLESSRALFVKAYSALGLSSAQSTEINLVRKTWATTHHNSSPTYYDLKEWVYDMDESQTDKGVSFDTLVCEEDESRQAGNSDQIYQTLITQPPGTKKSTNRPGTNDLAVRNTQKNVSFPNSYSKSPPDLELKGPAYRAK